MKKKLYYYFLLLILLSSCEEKINLKVPDSYTRIVVEGEITTEKKSHLIKLSVTSSYFVNQPTKYLSGANVSISDGNVTWQLKEKEAGHYYTESDVQGEVGKTYFLRIENVDVDGDGEQEVYTASELLKPCANPDSIACSKIKYMNDSVYEIKLWALEPEPVGDYYYWKFYVNGKLGSDSLQKASYTDDLIVNGNYIYGYPIIRFRKEQAKIFDTVMVAQMSITKEYYDYIISFLQITVWQGGNFSGPPANPKGNISNGGLGYFGACDIHYISTIIKP